MHRSSEPGPSSLAGTPTDAGGSSAAMANVAPPPPQPLQRLDFTGAPDERIISGQNRYKYFRRPIIPFMNAQPPEVVFAPVEADPASALELPQPEPEPLTKTVGTQSDFRESETQTNPYTSAYVLPSDASEPEVLTLTSLTYGQGLPAGLNEVKMIERARQKREFDASLPPMTDEASLALRRKMMGEQELRDWNVREEQILELQQEKLGTFDAGLRKRAQAREAHWDERIEHQRQVRLTEKDKEISQIQRRRVKALVSRRPVTFTRDRPGRKMPRHLRSRSPSERPRLAPPALPRSASSPRRVSSWSRARSRAMSFRSTPSMALRCTRR